MVIVTGGYECGESTELLLRLQKADEEVLKSTLCTCLRISLSNRPRCAAHHAYISSLLSSGDR